MGETFKLKMSSKEDILNKYFNGGSRFGKILLPNIKKAMDEYAKETSIEFIKWNEERKIERIKKKVSDAMDGVSNKIISTIELSIEERYNLFIKSLIK